MKLNKQFSLLFLTVVLSVSFVDAQQYYNVIKYGAKNDSSKIATKAIAAAINAAAKAGVGFISLQVNTLQGPFI